MPLVTSDNVTADALSYRGEGEGGWECRKTNDVTPDGTASGLRKAITCD